MLMVRGEEENWRVWVVIVSHMRCVENSNDQARFPGVGEGGGMNSIVLKFCLRY